MASMSFSSLLVIALLVIEEGKTQADDVKHAMDLLQGTYLVGTVLNKSLSSTQQEKNPSENWPSYLQARIQIVRAMFAGWFSRLRRKTQ